MHEEADGEGDIEATFWLDFSRLHAGGGGSETKALSWNGMSSEGEGVGWYSSQPVTWNHDNTQTNTVITLNM